jgi:hypothetical protein
LINTFSKPFIRIPGRLVLSALLVFVFELNIFPQEHKITGNVYDNSTKKALNYVSVYDINSLRGTHTNDSGFFEISMSEGLHNLAFSYTGYLRIDTACRISGDLKMTVFLTPFTVTMKEVVITARNLIDHVSSSQMSTFSLTNVEMKELPSLLGETDPLKILQLTPGVQAGSEGNIGFYVRGGGTDQNLILYDNNIVYNPGHLLGFFSVFNPDLIKDANIIKSGIPAQYGGKLSSVVTLNSYKGNKDSVEIMGSLGLISSRITIGGPVFKKNGSFIFGARRTYLELLMLPLVKSVVKNTAFFKNNSTYNFADFNAGMKLNISSRSNISFSGYFGHDKFTIDRPGIKQENSLKWGNSLYSLSWNHQIAREIELNSSISRTHYKFELLGSQSDYYFKLFSGVEDYALKNDISFKVDEHTAKAGIELTDHSFIPNRIDAQAGNFIVNIGQFGTMHALEGGIFLDDVFDLSPDFTISAGLRFSFFNHYGPFIEYKRDLSDQNSDTIYHQQGKSLAFFCNPEPRLVLKYQVNNNTSVKASYMRIAQYIHLATSASASLPTDIWIPSTSGIKPQIGNQVSIGYFRNFPLKSLEFTSEVYFKKMDNTLEFLRGIINNSIDGDLEENMVVGSGQSYGMELYLRKLTGKTTGWLSYTLSRTEQKFDEINEGFFYPAKYDRRHEISLALVRKFNEKWSGSAVFIFISGNAFTMPVGRYIIQGNIINEYGSVNSFRMPPYHRLDVSFNRKVITRKNWSSELIFSVYNVYSRPNPYFIYFEAIGDIDKYSLEVRAVQVSLFPVIPSVSWNFNF